MKEQKRIINKPISVEVKRIKKQRGEVVGEKSKEEGLEKPMIIQQMEMGGEGDQLLS